LTVYSYIVVILCGYKIVENSTKVFLRSADKSYITTTEDTMRPISKDIIRDIDMRFDGLLYAGFKVYEIYYSYYNNQTYYKLNGKYYIKGEI